MDNFNMSLMTTSSVTPQTQQQQQQKQKHKQPQKQRHLPPLKRKEGYGDRGFFRIKKCPQHLLAHNIVPILLCLCWLPGFIVALKDVSVTIPQAVKRGSNAMLTCNYDMENDTLYSVKWYKGRREFYRYTPKENPAMKVFLSQSGLNVERNLSNQSHVVLLAVPLNISGKFTCEISVEAPSFQTAMVSGEMEVVELPEEQATVTGIQPRYRIGDLVDGNCSIKYSKPAANLTWTINGIVVPPHHIKTYQIEKYEETNLESVLSAVHFMVTTQHFIKGQMRIKCTASIFDIFKEEIESIIEEDRPRIMASGQSHPPDHGYGTHGDSEGYEHNESYLTYFSAPKSSASPTADCIVSKIVRVLKQEVLIFFQLLMSLIETSTQYILTSTLFTNLKSSLATNKSIKTETTYCNVLQQILIRFITTVLAILLVAIFLQIVQRNILTKSLVDKMTQDKKMSFNCIENFRQIMKKWMESFLAINLWRTTQYRNKKEQQTANKNCYQDANDDDCQTKCVQQQHEKHYLAANQNVVNKKVFLNDTNINTINKNTNKKTIATITTAIDCQHHMSQTFAIVTVQPTSCDVIRLPPMRSSATTLLILLSLSSSPSSPSSLSLSSTLGHRKKFAHDSFPLCAVDASKSNNAKYMSKDQTLLMTFTANTENCVVVVAAPLATSNSLNKTPNAFAPITTTTTTRESGKALVLESEFLQTSVHTSLAIVERYSPPTPIFSRNNYLMAFIGELLLHQC